MKRRRHARGFTLIEVLVGLALLALIVGLLAGALRLGLRGADTVAARVAALDDLRTAQGLLRRHIENAQPILFNDESRGVVAFRGLPNGVQFVADMIGRDGRSGLWLVQLAIETVDARSRLTLTRRLLTAGPPQFVFDARDEQSLLFVSQGELRFSYFDGRRWRPTWAMSDGMPRLVRLQGPEEGQSDWLDFIAAPRLARGQP